MDMVDKQRDHIASGLMSDPGLSKTSQINQWAEEHGRKVVELIISQRMPSEISGMPMPVNESRTMEVFDFNLLLDMEDGDILFMDEFTNGNIQTLNACLTLVQDRMMLSGKKLPSIIVVAAGNPQGRCDLLPQTKQRFLWVDVKFDADTWTQYMKDTWGMKVSKVVVDYIEQQYRNGFKSDEFNYMTARTAENLVRIAQDIPRNDVFWDIYRADRQLVDGIYKTVDSAQRLTNLSKTCTNWVDMMLNCQGDPTVIKQFKKLRSDIEQAGSWQEMSELIDRIENDGAHGDPGQAFVKYLQSSSEKSVINPKAV